MWLVIKVLLLIVLVPLAVRALVISLPIIGEVLLLLFVVPYVFISRPFKVREWRKAHPDDQFSHKLRESLRNVREKNHESNR